MEPDTVPLRALWLEALVLLTCRGRVASRRERELVSKEVTTRVSIPHSRRPPRSARFWVKGSVVRGAFSDSEWLMHHINGNGASPFSERKPSATRS